MHRRKRDLVDIIEQIGNVRSSRIEQVCDPVRILRTGIGLSGPAINALPDFISLRAHALVDNVATTVATFYNEPSRSVGVVYFYLPELYQRRWPINPVFQFSSPSVLAYRVHVVPTFCGVISSLASRLYYILAELVSLYKAWYPGRGYRSWLQKFKPRQITGDNRYTAGHVILSHHSLDI